MTSEQIPGNYELPFSVGTVLRSQGVLDSIHNIIATQNQQHTRASGAHDEQTRAVLQYKVGDMQISAVNERDRTAQTIPYNALWPMYKDLVNRVKDLGLQRLEEGAAALHQTLQYHEEDVALTRDLLGEDTPIIADLLQSNIQRTQDRIAHVEHNIGYRDSLVSGLAQLDELFDVVGKPWPVPTAELPEHLPRHIREMLHKPATAEPAVDVQPASVLEGITPSFTAAENTEDSESTTYSPVATAALFIGPPLVEAEAVVDADEVPTTGAEVPGETEPSETPKLSYPKRIAAVLIGSLKEALTSQQLAEQIFSPEEADALLEQSSRPASHRVAAILGGPRHKQALRNLLGPDYVLQVRQERTTPPGTGLVHRTNFYRVVPAKSPEAAPTSADTPENWRPL